ncbi:MULTISPECIES: type II secretion system F family protein [Halocynthiibacter]|uniref:Type II secretion system F family protein n=1 Tax=Halocynthiibacter halioticoli TaxID=2986804 RepID=A0AAE3J257_9RHOB|nr:MULTISPECIES: type II secretion system F family protein [Halocynthiibacter]MCV6825276.1 type II secretion system F family protein [Halocynthiibacter halioticoli]MCW4058277.1 type II secretion system F family protein [Halocynthiibacter sp. SDUM655004]MDE0588702.1 type II secretion system F family protein [Halocynthiibacter sp. C4]
MEFFSSINTMLTDNFGPFGPLLVAGIVGLFLILGTLPVLLRKEEDPLDKLKKSMNKQSASKGKAENLRQGKNDKLEKYSNFLEPQTEEEYSAMRLKMMQAGYRDKNAIRTFHFAQFALGIGGLALGGLYVLINASSSGQEVSMQSSILTLLIPGAIGYMAPKYWVSRRQQTRQEAIINGFPDSLDMMLVCVEAGQSMDQSILRVSEEIRAGFPDLADEFEIVSNESKAGKDKVAVLNDMADRCGVQDVRSFVTVLNQSQTFGTSIAGALRVYAEEMRDKRVMRAEEKANKLPTKMTLATMMLTVPPLLIILIGPSVYGIATQLGGIKF